MQCRHNSNGFSLVEILVAMAVSGLVMTAIYQTYQSQQRSYVLQDSIAKMQQNLRASMYLMTREIRMAGFDPTGNAGAGIVAGGWSANSLHFTKDDNSDGDVADSSEDLTYSLYTVGGVQKLGRKNPTTNQPVAEYIDALNFAYLDGDNNVTATLSEVRSVVVTIVARTEREDSNYTNNLPYYSKLGGAPVFTGSGDRYHRSVLSEQVKCRNLGL